jgi:hypothetical protein
VLTDDSRIVNIAGGSINTSGGSGAGGGGGSINLSGGNEDGGNIGADGGSISLAGGQDGCSAGRIISNGGIGHDAVGGTLNMSGGSDSNGGSITTAGANISGADEWNGGSIDTSGGANGAGGSINTSNGGGSINTSGGVNNGDPFGGGSINTSAGGSINTSNEGGSINTSGNSGGDAGGSINTSAGENGVGGSINTSNGGGSINTSSNAGGTGGHINLSPSNYMGDNYPSSGNGGSIELTGGHGEETTGGNGGNIYLRGAGGGQGHAGSIISNGAFDGSNYIPKNGGTLNMSAHSSGVGGSINTSGGARGAGGSINLSNGGGSLIATTGVHFNSLTNAYGGNAGGSGTINLSGGDATNASNPQDSWAYQVVLTTVTFDSLARGTYVRSVNRGTFEKTTNTSAFPKYFISQGTTTSGGQTVPLFTLYRQNSAFSSTILAYNTGTVSIGNPWRASASGTGAITAVGVATLNGYGQNGGSGGSLLMAGGDGSSALSAPLFAGGSAGTINTSANNLGNNGGFINTSAGTDGAGGSINTSNAGGSINTSNAGGLIDTSNAGGSINTSSGGGSINLSSVGGGINLSNKGGYIKSTGGGEENISGGNTGGSIDLSCSPSPQYASAVGGSINLTGGNYGRAGSISSTGGYGDNNERGGDLDMSGRSKRGGDILTHGGDYDGLEGGYGLGAEGGDILTYGGQYTGGSINTSDGGGSINTRGVGSVQLGQAGTRTTLNGSASGSNKTITLPNSTGTIALTNDSRFTDSRAPTSHTHGNITNDGKVLVPYGGILSATGVDAGSFSNGTFPMIQGSGAGGVITILNGVISVTSAGSGYVDGGATKAGGSRYNLVTQSTQNASANLPVITTTGGNISAGSFGTTANTFCQGDDARLSNPFVITMSHSSASLTANGQVAYLGNFMDASISGASSQPSGRNFVVPFAAKIVGVGVTMYFQTGQPANTTNSTLATLLFEICEKTSADSDTVATNGSTSPLSATLISANIHNAPTAKAYSKYANNLNIPLTAGKDYVIRMTGGAFTTYPTSYRSVVMLWMV